MKVLVIGDIVGRPGREAVATFVPQLRREFTLDWVIANAENAAGGSGVTQNIAAELFATGIDVLTTGNHIWSKPEIFPILDSDHRILRPANYPKTSPGVGAATYAGKNGTTFGVANVMGRVFMDVCDCPFATATACVEELRKTTPLIFVDMHAEATSEKVAMGWFLDGQVSCVFGTHTHIPTADERVLPGGTAYITDLGMTGPYDSVIGRNKEQIIKRFVTHMPVKFEMAEHDVQLRGALIEVDPQTGKALAIERVTRKLGT